MRSARLIVFALFILAGLSLAFAADVPSSYISQCASCHGADGKGKNSGASKFEAPDLRSKKVQDLSDDELYDSIARGTRHKDYPHAFLYRGLKEKDIRELVKYIRTLSLPTK